jgi:hypothetical protein
MMGGALVCAYGPVSSPIQPADARDANVAIEGRNAALTESAVRHELHQSNATSGLPA